MPAPDLASYDRFVVAFSGGKDSIASLLTLLDAGVSASRIDCYHHDVDGAGPGFMDWPCTTAYCRAVTQALDVPLYLSWREGGFLREMLRDGTPTAPIRFQTPEGLVQQVGGAGQPGTRLRFPQVTANLNQRWCSAYLKIDCATRGRTFACPYRFDGNGPAAPSAEPTGMGVESNFRVQSCRNNVASSNKVLNVARQTRRLQASKRSRR